MSYYKDKEKADPSSINREKVGNRDINDPLFDTDQRDKRMDEGSSRTEADPSVPKEYDGSKNAGGSKSATTDPEQ
ncbi:hypothetical protein GWC95_06280 [Sediminibacterium roseum]|uniref:Uncharacterized protein n=1 Tax=Sediminibacterium roseum TaxID=1978412 RepID=A0ABW9ZSW3_9BACT|nr:hypothetical protein [Sediminibacterium roseum]NCI49522.1 hypothetical protein [Sediminibacterium roseum]